MTPYWTFIFNELTGSASYPIGARRNFVESSSAWS